MFSPLEIMLREPEFEGITLSIGNAKKEDRCLEKTKQFNQLRDIRRVSMVCNSVEQARRLTNRVENGAECSCRRCKLGFSKDFDDNVSSGYRDAQLNLSCPGSGLIFELQVHHDQIHAVKTGLGGGGHKNYKSFRQRKESIQQLRSSRRLMHWGFWKVVTCTAPFRRLHSISPQSRRLLRRRSSMPSTVAP